MRIILLATNETARLDPLHHTFAAPMLPIVNRPVMATTVEMLARAGYKDLLVSLYNSSGGIAEYFGNGTRWGLRINYVVQRESLGSAGSLKWASRLLEETFLVLPGDAILDLDVAAALQFHQQHNAPVTAILSQRRTAATEMLRLDADGLVCEAGHNLVGDQVFFATGAYIIEPAILDHVERRTYCDIYTQLLPHLLAGDVAVRGYCTSAYWNPLNTVAEYQEAQQVFLYSAFQATETDAMPADLPRVRYPSIEGRQVVPGVWVGRNHVIHPSVRIAAPICIGDNCWIGQHAEISAGSVIGSNVVIDAEATVAQSTILAQTYIGQFVNINHRIVHINKMIDPENGECSEVVDPFLIGAVRNLVHNQQRRSYSVAAIVAGILLLFLSPVLIVLALVAFLASGGRIMRRERSIGRRPLDPPYTNPSELKPFDLFVFETTRRDGSTSPVGHWLQRTELYRLPLLWSVWRGDLALVGVKPLSPEEVGRLDEEWHQKRFECPAGFTGLWYVQPFSGTNLEEILVSDAYYAATHTWWNDLRILLRTPAAWRRRMALDQANSSLNQDLLHADS
jgi:NDP-sugar pyrophosphorylase family protein